MKANSVFELTNFKLTRMSSEPRSSSYFTECPLNEDQSAEVMRLIETVLIANGIGLSKPMKGKVSLNWWDGKMLLEKINLADNTIEDDEED